MRRPLLCGCVCLFVLISLWLQVTNPPPWDVDNTGWEGKEVSLKGQVYQKEYRNSYGEEKLVIYLSSVYYSKEATASVFQSSMFSEKLSKMNPTERIICEINLNSLAEVGHVPALGSKVIVKGKWKRFQHATNPGEFDAANYYAMEGICARIQDAQLLGCGNTYWLIRESLFGVRQYLLKNLYSTFPQKDAAILAKMLLGDGSGLDPEIRELYQSNGIVHILSISGLHITMLGMGVYICLRKLTLPIVPAALSGGVMILLYGMMVGFNVSVFRAIGMYLIRMLGEIWGRSYDMLTAMGVLAVVMLIDNPLLAYHSGYLLSFASVCGLGLLAPMLEVDGERIQKKPYDKKWVVLGKSLLSGMMSGFSASLAITIFTLPVQLFFFYKIPVYSVFINLLVIPFMSLVMGMGILIMLGPVLAFLAPVEIGIFQWFETLCYMFEKLPGHTLISGRPFMGKILIYYIGLIVVLLLGKRLKRYQSLLGMVVLLVVMLVRLPGKPEIYLLDVGQGDCICIRTSDNQCLLFDGGSSSKQNVGKKIITPFLEYHGIDRIRGVFLSHADMDHYSGILQILEEELMTVDKIYLPNVGMESKKDFQKVLSVVEPEKIQYVQKGDCWKAEDFILHCLHPDKGFEGESNEYSGCFLLDMGEFVMLLTGDVEGEGERLLLMELKEREVKKVDVLKVAHHGSRNSTSVELLKQINPETALISSGKNNIYGHPHRETVERLQASGSVIMITAEYGAITIEPEKNVLIRGWKEPTE